MPDAPKEQDEEIPVEIIEGDGGSAIVQPEIEAKKPDAEPAKIVSGEEGAEELKRKLDEERTRREAAEAVARTATEQVGQAKAAVEDGELREIQTSIDVTKRNLDMAKQQYRNARAAGDVDGELEATEAIAQAKADLNSLEAGKSAREHAKKNPQPQPQFHQDPVEVVVGSLARWPQSQAWVRNHPEMARDPSKWRATVAASDLALARGLAADTPAYFAHIEGTLQANGIMPMPGGSANGNGNGNGNGAAPVKTEETVMSQASRPVAPAAAPPSRSGSAPSGQKPGTIRLTREQAEMAELSFPQLVKEKGATAAHRAYAQAMVEAKAEGKIN
jgi:hypothetical protein